jgi:hypothetical protein
MILLSAIVQQFLGNLEGYELQQLQLQLLPRSLQVRRLDFEYRCDMSLPNHMYTNGASVNW